MTVRYDLVLAVALAAWYGERRVYTHDDDPSISYQSY